MTTEWSHHSLPASTRDMNPISFSDPSLPLAVVVASTHWDEPPRMRHDVTRQLARFFNVVFVEFFPAGKRGGAETSWRKVYERLLICTLTDKFRVPPRLMANDPFTHSRTNRRYVTAIYEAICGLPGKHRLLFNFVYDFPEIMRSGHFDWTSYVCFDEFPRMQRRSRQRNPLKTWYQARLFQYYENRVAQEAVRCFTPHYPLRDKLKKVNPKVEMLFHACDGTVKDNQMHDTENRIISVGFAGFIHYRLLDDWLLAVAEQQDMTLHVIGPVLNYDMTWLTRYSNVRHIPSLLGLNLYEKLSEMDVLVIPINSELPEVRVITTNSKTFQYVSTGKPIVISDLPHYIQLPRGVLYKANSPKDFVAKIRQAHSEDCEEFVRLRLKIAAENTWDKRGDMLYSIVQQDLGEKLSITA
jgi:glycosyltransferase involved in cell wall biosynthesis